MLIDAGGAGTYSDVSRREDGDTIRRENEIATRTYDGNSVVWMGACAFGDSDEVTATTADRLVARPAAGPRSKFDGSRTSSIPRDPP